MSGLTLNIPRTHSGQWVFHLLFFLILTGGNYYENYKKPMITVDSGLAEGVYAASGASQGTLNVTYYGVWDRWGTNGGKGLAMANWSDLNGTITLNITFNDTVDQAETDDASVQTSWSGKTATFTFASTASNPLTIGIHLNHGTSIDDLKMTGFTYSVN